MCGGRGVGGGEEEQIIFPFRVHPFSDGRQNTFDSVASLKSVPITPQVCEACWELAFEIAQQHLST